MRPDPTPEHVDHLATISKAKGFLGREFLTWLWYTAETSREAMRLTAAGQAYEFDLWIDDKVVLESGGGVAQQHAMKGGDPSQSREASAALATGKTVRELKIGLNDKGLGEFTASLNADDLSPRGLKLPNPESGTAPSDELPLATRLRRMDTFLALLDGLFARFLEERTSDAWEKDGLTAIRAWIKKRQKQAESATLH
jgi:hypothetical protein